MIMDELMKNLASFFVVYLDGGFFFFFGDMYHMTMPNKGLESGVVGSRL